MKKFNISILLFMCLVICLFNTHTTPGPTISPTTVSQVTPWASPFPSSIAEPDMALSPVFTPVVIEESSLNIKKLMTLAQENGKTDEEKYGNYVYAIGIYASMLLVDLSDNLEPFKGYMSPEGTPAAETPSPVTPLAQSTDTVVTGTKSPVVTTDPNTLMPSMEDISNLKSNLLKDKKIIENIKSSFIDLKVPQGYDEIHKNLITTYDKLLEGIGSTYNCVANEDFKNLKTSLEIIDGAGSIMRDTVMGLDEKGYHPSPEYNDLVNKKFKFSE